MQQLIVLVEDDHEIRQSLIDMFQNETEFNVICATDTVKAGIAAVEQYQPDILLTDLGLPDGSGVDIIQASTVYQNIKAIVISGFQDERHVFSALQAGATGYILKQDTSLNIVNAIKSMLKGGAPISPMIARLVLKYFQSIQSSPFCTSKSNQENQLTDRQMKILKFVSQGFSSKEIAEKLNISYFTVTTHIKNIYKCLEVNSRTEAVSEARKLGFLS